MAWGNSADTDLIQETVRSNLNVGDPQAMVSFIGLVNRSNVPALTELLWPLLHHGSKPVHTAAAQSSADWATSRSVVPPVSWRRKRPASVRLR